MSSKRQRHMQRLNCMPLLKPSNHDMLMDAIDNLSSVYDSIEDCDPDMFLEDLGEFEYNNPHLSKSETTEGGE